MDSIQYLVQQWTQAMQAFRRDIHAFPELGWLEYRTTSKVAELFMGLGYDIVLGAEAIHAHSRLTPPSSDKCARHKARAIIQGAQPALVERMGDGLTGLWVDIPLGDDSHGAPTGPLIAFRFDMDANSVEESHEPEHVPMEQGFVSHNGAIMHACGHDGHVAMGIGLGLALHAWRQKHTELGLPPLHGTVRLIFQPAEEIGQGAKAMLAAGAIQEVQEVYGIHIGIQAQRPELLIAGTTHFLANTTFEVLFEGKAAHSGLAPQEGRNALLAATTAVQGMHSISRHGQGETRINVGQFEVQGAPNVVPCKAFLVGETRAVHCPINTWMTEEAQRICEGAAHMWGCTAHFTVVGSCINGFSDIALAKEVCDIAQTMPCFDTCLPTEKFMASEDFTWFLDAVQKQGGQGTFIQLGAKLASGHHSQAFDFDEGTLSRGLELLLRIIQKKLG